MQNVEGLVFRFADLSRLLLVTLIIIWRSLLPPYDSSAQLNPSCLSSLTTIGDPSSSDAVDRVLWPWVGAAIECSVVWDGVYFVRISECGYEYKQTYAFLPLLPISIAFLSRSGKRVIGRYSESLYALSSLYRIFYLFFDSNTMAMLLLGVFGAARSNRAINAGYFCFKALCQAYDAITQKRTIRVASMPYMKKSFS